MASWTKGEKLSKDAERRVMNLLYQQFMLQGGETGYIHMQDIDQITSNIEKEIRKIAKMPKNMLESAEFSKLWQKVWVGGGNALEHFAIRSENLSRFAAYVTAIKEGKSQREAAKAAKDVTVNFNRKGRVSGLFGSLYAFFNAAFQGGANVVGMAKANPKKFWFTQAGMVGLGVMTAFLASMWSGDDDEDGTNDYDQLNDYLKYNYLTIPIPNSRRFLTLPMPHGFKAFYSVGVVMMQAQKGEKEIDEALKTIVANAFDSMSPVNPVDLFGEDGKLSFRPVVPTFAVPVHDLIVNEDFAGRMIYRKPYSVAQEGRLADSSLGMKNVNKYLKMATDKLFQWGGGDVEIGQKAKYNPDGSVKVNDKGEVEIVKEWADVNPSKIEYFLEYMFGGRGKFWNNTLKLMTGTIESTVRATKDVMATDDDPVFQRLKAEFGEELHNFEVNDLPVIHRMLRQPYGNGPVDEFYRISNELNTYKQAKSKRQVKFGEDFETFGDNKTDRAMEIYDLYMEDLNDLKQDMIESSNPEVVEMIKKQREYLMTQFVKQYKMIYAQKQ